MKILFLFMNPFDWASIAAPPYGLEIISNYLKQCYEDVETKIMNPFIDEGESIGNLIREYKPQLIGLSMRNLDNMANIWSEKVKGFNGIKTKGFVERIGYIVTKIKEVTNTDIFIGGAGFSIAPESILRRIGLNCGIVGPGEYTVRKMVGAIKNGEVLTDYIEKNYRSLAGIIYLKENEVLTSPPEHCMEKKRIDKFERVNEYSHKWTGTVPVRVSTGCSGKCSFCVEGVLFERDKWRNKEEIVEEIRNIKDEDAAVWLVCSELNYPDGNQMLELCREIRNSRIKRRFSSYFLPKQFTTEMYRTLKDIGFIDYSICFGMVHVSDSILSKNRVGFSQKDIDKVVQIFQEERAEGITTGLILGLPGETIETLDEVIAWMKKMGDIFGEGFRCSYNCGARVYPNTFLANMVAADENCNHYLYGNMEDKDLLEPLVYSSPFSPEEINRYIKDRIQGCKGLIASYNMGNEMMSDNCSVIIDWQKAQYLKGGNNSIEALKKLVSAFKNTDINNVQALLMSEIIQSVISIKKANLIETEELCSILRDTIFINLLT